MAFTNFPTKNRSLQGIEQIQHHDIILYIPRVECNFNRPSKVYVGVPPASATSGTASWSAQDVITETKFASFLGANPAKKRYQKEPSGSKMDMLGNVMGRDSK